MAGRGPAPKDPEKRERRNAEVPMTELDPASAPTKARALPGASKFTAATRRRWRIWATSPQAAHFLETDWLVLERLAVLWDAFERGNHTVANEIRLVEAKLGGTPEDRLRLRWRLSQNRDAEEKNDRPARVAREHGDPRLKLVGGQPV